MKKERTPSMEREWNILSNKIQTRETSQRESYMKTRSSLESNKASALNTLKQLQEAKAKMPQTDNPYYPSKSISEGYSQRINKEQAVEKSINKAQTQQKIKRTVQSVLNKTEQAGIKVAKVGDKIVSSAEKAFSKPMLKKPSVSVPKYDSTKLLKQMASQQGGLVREVPRSIPVQDNRSLFFRSELNNQAKKDKSWLMSD